MKSFLCRGKRPIIRWSLLPDNTFFEGKLPEGYSLAVMPSHDYIVVDVDRHGSIDGFEKIPHNVNYHLTQTLHYKTKNNGMHFWLRYTGDKPLANKGNGEGIDLRVGFKGYVIWYPDIDIRDNLHRINETNDTLNKWLERQFSYVTK